MDKTLIIGAHGKIGKLLVAQMKTAGMPVKAMVRKPEQKAELLALGAEVLIADLEQELPDQAFTDCKKVVFTAGSGGHTGADKTILVDLWGACKAVDKARAAGIEHFVMISSRDAGNPERESASIKYYNICKHFADNHLQASGLHYTILRPGRLTDEPPTGLITTTRAADKDKLFIPRADVAACIVYSLQQTASIDRISEIYHGDTAIPEALVT